MGRVSVVALSFCLSGLGWAGPLERARQAEREGRYAEALAALAEHLESNPGDRQARIERLHLLIEDDRLDEAQEVLALEMQTAEPDALLLNQQGRLFFSQGRFTEAVKSLAQAVEKDPSFIKALHNMGMARERAGDLAGAQSAFEKALSLDPGSVGAMNGLGMLKARAGKADQALAFLKQAENIDPADAETLCNLGLVQRMKGNYQSSVDYLCQAVGARKSDPVMRNEYARALIYARELGAAQIELEQILGAEPEFAPAILNRGILAEEQGKREEAKAIYIAALKRDPQLGEAAFRLGNIALGFALAAKTNRAFAETASHFDAAIGYFRQAVTAQPAFVEARYNLVLTLLEIGRNEEAVEEARELARVDPGKVRHQMLLGAVMTQQGRAEEAMMAFRRAGQLDTSCLECRLRLGNIALRTGNFAEAAKAYREAAALDEKDAQIPYLLGQVFYRQGELKAARKEVQKALALKPDYMEAVEAAANVSMRMKDMAAASSYVSRGVEIDPAYLGIFRTAEMVFAQSQEIRLGGSAKAMKILTAYLRGIRAATEDTGRARAAFEEILEVEPRCAAAHLKLGMLNVLAGNSELGIKHLAQANSLSPRDSEVLYALATGYYDQAEKKTGKEAAPLYEKACEIYREATGVSSQDAEAHRIYWGLGSALYKLGRFDEARRELESCLKMNPFFSEAYNTLGSVIANQAQAATGPAERKALLEEAIQFYQRALRANANSPTAYYNLGTMYHELKRYKEAIVAYETAIRLNPNFGPARYRLALLYDERGNWPFDRGRAEKEFKELIEVEPGNCSFISDFGAFYFNTRQYQKAKEIWQKVISLCPDYRPARDGLEKLIEMGY